MRDRFLLILLSLLLAACTTKNSHQEDEKKPSEIIISGEIEKGSDLLVTLDLMGANELIPISEKRCDTRGKFSFNFSREGMNYFSLKYTDNGYVTIIAEPGDEIHIKGVADNIYPYEVSGSKASDLVRELSIEHKKALDQLVQISNTSSELLGAENYVQKKLVLNRRFDSITESFHVYSKEFIIKNSNSPAILIALYNQFGPEFPVFDPLADLDIYKFADSSLFANYHDNEAVKTLHSQLSSALQQISNQNSKRSLEKGMSAPDFVLENQNGRKVTLSELRGNYVLLHIWASWSKPSVEENAYLKECNEKFGNRSFTIFQVSIDDDKEAWLNGIENQELNWIHASDLKRWESAIISLYGIERIPTNFLIDPEGKIVETELFGKDLLKKIEKYIH